MRKILVILLVSIATLSYSQTFIQVNEFVTHKDTVQYGCYLRIQNTVLNGNLHLGVYCYKDKIEYIMTPHLWKPYTYDELFSYKIYKWEGGDTNTVAFDLYKESILSKNKNWESKNIIKD